MVSTFILSRFLCIFMIFVIFKPERINGYLEYEDDPYSREKEFRELSENVEDYDPCARGVRCVPPIQCPAHVMKHNRKPERCRLPGNYLGYCCITGQNSTEVRDGKWRSHSSYRNFAIMREIIQEARAKVQKMSHNSLHWVRRGYPDFFHHMIFQSPIVNFANDNKISNWAIEQIFTGQLFKEKEQISLDELFNGIDMTGDESSSEGCIPIPKCRNINSKYRTANGNCNNPLPERSFWGAAGQPMERLLSPAYEDGIWVARQYSAGGSLLSSARRISRILLPDLNRPHARSNLLFMQFGQFISHDFTQSASMRHDDGRPIQCCTDDGSIVLEPEERHYACMPIFVEPDDEYYSEFNQGCINFVRLSLAPYFNCRIGFGKQISKVTHYLDGSQIYGSSVESQSQVRSFHGGKLQLYSTVGGNMLPKTRNNDSCAGTTEGNICYLSGDGRTNQIISLTLLHAIFAREHNRVAESLARLDLYQSDEMLFQEARRIVIAELQHIIYTEYLPLLVGSPAMQRFQLNVKEFGYSTDYDPDVNAAILNEFTGAAYRFGHSAVDGKLKINSGDWIDIPDVMFNPGRLEEPLFFENLVVTLLSQNMQEIDNSITRGLTGNMFRGSQSFGIDLAALNIQRGRDQGIRSYNDYLEVIGQGRIQSFDEFGRMGRKLRDVYDHPDDVDLWIGGLMESVYEDATVGQTFSEIIADQFSRFRRGDRYFYTNDPRINPGHFTPCQLNELRKASLARILCDNVQNLEYIQPLAFVRFDYPGNDLTSCNNIPKLNFGCWSK